MRKNLFLLTTIVVVVIFNACNKKEDVEMTGVKFQNHDDNRMMDSMHVTMDRMEAMVMTMDADVDFAEMMMMHHEGAINMSSDLIASGKNDSLKRFAQKVITDQEKEIMEFDEILMKISVDDMDMEFMQELEDNMEKMNRLLDTQLITGDIDNDYATLMIFHHQGAMDDANSYLHLGTNTELKAIAKNIVSTQGKEIIELSNWINTNKR